MNDTLARTLQIKNLYYLLLTVTILLTSGCAGPNAQRMVPQLSTSSEFTTNQSIRTIRVRGEKDEVFGGPAFATKEQIFEATQSTLRQSGLFNSVNNGEGDIDLNVIVRSQGQDVSSMLEYRGIITITYRFTNTDGEIIWLKTLESGFSSHAFSGATRTVEAREGCVRENMMALIQSIKANWANL